MKEENKDSDMRATQKSLHKDIQTWYSSICDSIAIKINTLKIIKKMDYAVKNQLTNTLQLLPLSFSFFLSRSARDAQMGVQRPVRSRATLASRKQ